MRKRCAHADNKVLINYTFVLKVGDKLKRD